MIQRTINYLLPALVAGFLLVATADRAMADAPEIIKFDETFEDAELSAHCGVPVEIHFEARIVARPDGRSSSELTVTYTNLDTGVEVVYKSSGSGKTSIDPDTGVVVNTTLGGSRIIVPGEGAVYVVAGRAVETIVFDTETGDLLSYELVSHGRRGDVDLLEVICALLTA